MKNNDEHLKLYLNKFNIGEIVQYQKNFFGIVKEIRQYFIQNHIEYGYILNTQSNIDVYDVQYSENRLSKATLKFKNIQVEDIVETNDNELCRVIKVLDWFFIVQKEVDYFAPYTQIRIYCKITGFRVHSFIDGTLKRDDRIERIAIKYSDIKKILEQNSKFKKLYNTKLDHDVYGNLHGYTMGYYYIPENFND